MKVEAANSGREPGDVIGDLSRRRGMREVGIHVTGVMIHAELRCLKCSDMQPTAFTDQGRASYTMEFLKYDDARTTLLRPLLKPM
ncbi:hypothetical protein ACNKHO_21025 [Shigella flexneri]